MRTRPRLWAIIIAFFKFITRPWSMLCNWRKKTARQRSTKYTLLVAERDSAKEAATQTAQSARSMLKAKEQELRRKEEELQAKEGELRAKEWELSAKGWDLKVKNDELAISREDGQRKTHRIASLEAEVRQATARNNILKRTLQETQASLLQSEDAISQQQRQIHDLQKSLEQRTELLDARSKELAAAQAFLGAQDAYTYTQVTSLVSDLNCEIQQTAVCLADVVVTVGERDATPWWSIDPAVVEMLEPIVGDRMIKGLWEADHVQDPLLLERAFQAVLASVSRSISTRWHFGPYPQAVFEDTFESLFLEEPGTVSGRWRSLARKYGKVALESDVDPMVSAAHTFVTNITYITALAGFASASDAVEARLTSSIGDKLREIAAMALKLNKVIGEEITSSAMSLTIVNPGSPFDAAEMEVGDGDEGSSGDGTCVLCTTGLGLERRVKKEDREVETTVLVKPKVMLESIVEMTDGLDEEDKMQVTSPPVEPRLLYAEPGY